MWKGVQIPPQNVFGCLGIERKWHYMLYLYKNVTIYCICIHILHRLYSYTVAFPFRFHRLISLIFPNLVGGFNPCDGRGENTFIIWNHHLEIIFRTFWRLPEGWIAFRQTQDFWGVAFSPNKPTNLGRNFTYLEDPGMKVYLDICDHLWKTSFPRLPNTKREEGKTRVCWLYFPSL